MSADGVNWQPNRCSVSAVNVSDHCIVVAGGYVILIAITLIQMKSLNVTW